MEKITQIAKASFFFALTILLLSFTFRVLSGDGCGPKKFHGGKHGSHEKCGKMGGHHDMMMFNVDGKEFDISEHLKGIDLPEDVLEIIKDELKNIDIEINAEDGEDKIKVIVKTITTDEE
ncbi:MAG: hypothetical protein H8E71_07210 [Candidatus Marinimicrobia bacterium]|nr:hypothetical protein [Candidatus Neomarinimicrobiota bacterium]MBL7109007.1 hypothetical protein [Candidatus Neomarinimicrobiota bacterium]